MVSVWPTDINRGGCLRAKEPGPGGLAAQGVLNPSATLLSCHSTPATQEGSAPRHPVLMELLEYGAYLPIPFQTFKISPSSKSLQKFLGADLCLPTLHLQNKDIKKNFFLPPIPLFHKRHSNTKNKKRYTEHFRIKQRPFNLLYLALIC